jgi:hypothetical protein
LQLAVKDISGLSDCNDKEKHEEKPNDDTKRYDDR